MCGKFKIILYCWIINFEGYVIMIDRDVVIRLRGINFCYSVWIYLEVMGI